LDGINILSIIEGNKATRPEPIKFWNAGPRNQKGSEPKPYIDLKLQMGTTPLAKIQDGVATRNFKNFHHQDIKEQDFMGPRAILDNNYKLVIHDLANGKPSIELFDVQNDPAEKNNLISRHTEIAKSLKKKLRQWQESVLKSLIGEDYN
jgi:arylsulfatase A-like enzyme